MTDRNRDKPGEFTWYSRTATWIGAAMLLAQSVLGRSAGAVTVLAVLLLGLGFLAFLIGLALDARIPVATALLLYPTTEETVLETPDNELPGAGPEPGSPEGGELEGVSVPSSAGDDIPAREVSGRRSSAQQPDTIATVRRPKFRERGKKSERLAKSPQKVPVAPTRNVAPPEIAHTGVRTELLSDETAVVYLPCPGCDQGFMSGQFVAFCPTCGTLHHATCWIENGFHCDRADCPGHGSLREPGAS